MSSWHQGDPRPYSQQYEFLRDVLDTGGLGADADGELDRLCAEVCDWGRAHPGSNPWLDGRPAPTLRVTAAIALLDRLEAYVRRNTTPAPTTLPE